MDIAKLRKKVREDETLQAPSEVSETPAEGLRAPEPVRADKQDGGGTRPAAGEEEGRDVTIEVLTFALGREEYGFQIKDIEEIIRPQSITSIPRSEPYLVGITSLRGKIIPVIDLKRRLALNGDPEKKNQKILIIRGPRGPIGVMVDRVIGVIRPQVSGIEDAPPHLHESEMRFIDGVALVDGRFVSLVKTQEAVDIFS